MFGTPEGAKLQQWCIAMGWPLAWTHNPNPRPLEFPPLWNFSHGVQKANIRLLDPVVLSRVPAGFNRTMGPDGTDISAEVLAAEVAFNQSWQAVVAAVPSLLALIGQRVGVPWTHSGRASWAWTRKTTEESAILRRPSSQFILAPAQASDVLVCV